MYKQKAYYGCLLGRTEILFRVIYFILFMVIHNPINHLFYVPFGIKRRVYLERVTNGR